MQNYSNTTSSQEDKVIEVQLTDFDREFNKLLSKYNVEVPQSKKINIANLYRDTSNDVFSAVNDFGGKNCIKSN